MEGVEGSCPPWPAYRLKKRRTGIYTNQSASHKLPKVEAEDDSSALPSPRPHPHPLSSNCSHTSSAFSDVSASFDLASLDCPSCRKPLQSPIFQCYSGHYACSSCDDSNMRKCSKCSKPTGKIRNIGLESIIETLRIKCKFSSGGCKEVLRHCERKDHELVCVYAPHMCPILDCDFCGLLKDLLEHLIVLHKARSLEFPASNSVRFSLGKQDIYIVLQVESKPAFLLHNKKETIGNIVYLTSFCMPSSESKVSWSYELNVCKGQTKLTLASVVHSHENLIVEAKAADFLVIPKHFFDIRRYVDATSDYFDLCKKVDVEISIMQTESNGLKPQS